MSVFPSHRDIVPDKAIIIQKALQS
ncbi:hypothetical protein Z4320 [Escherichia coli O157:H7 str. EDL933]|uniref:Uncharacterized protein n=1 Tax=Escherichia coli O157:H7 TaxID=83334 RepID=Q8X4B2_ECO57|nr:hypothetical protein Z4320 [Escherichia coli O157:H7 str. EDL933]